jgi:FkbM family methyltransferase
VIYDIGANVGTWTLLAKAILPQANIHAFEPLQIHHEAFEKAMQNISDISLHKVALGSRAGTGNMQVINFSDASSFLKMTEATEKNFGITKEREEKVSIVTLDEYVSTAKIPLPALIKLDIQGYELEAMRGGKKCLRHANHIICEVSFLELYKGQAFFHDIVEFLHQCGFHLQALGVNTPLGQSLSQADVLFSRVS